MASPTALTARRINILPARLQNRSEVRAPRGSFGLKASETYNAHKIAERLRDHKLMTAFGAVAIGRRRDHHENGGAGPAVGTIMRQIMITSCWATTTPICLRKTVILQRRRTAVALTDNPNKKTFWDKNSYRSHDATPSAGVAGLQRALVIWSASGAGLSA